ncbi:MAG TPA: hypothetical protein VGY96_19460 [Streptosporangiaceae bacterium]|jgi:hypothetical protein|nr:hypothetical protein [Streptosporangiaceae bacterium]
MIVRWIWSVPPAMEMPGTERKISAIVPSSGDPGPASMPCGPAISAWTRAACRAMTLLASLPSEPSGPGGRPAARAAAARSAVHRADQASSASRAISWRTSGSPARPCATARPVTRSGRPARCGYHLCGSLAAVRSAIASRQARPVAPAGTGPGRDAARRRSCARIDSATVQPPPCSPIR